MALFATHNADTEAQVRGSDLFPVCLAVMQPGTLAPVDLFMQTGDPGRCVLYKGSGATLNDGVRQRLIDNHVNQLYVRKSDAEPYYSYVEQHITAIIRDDMLPIEEACTLVHENSCRVMRSVFENPRSGRNLRRAYAMVESMVLSVLKNPAALWHITALASHDYVTYQHSVNVALFLVATARDLLGVKRLRELKRVAFGGVLHDVGKSQVPADILNRPGELSDRELARIKQHPLVGLDIVGGCGKLSRTAASIIRSHHENVDGSGYPDGLKWDSIPPVARLARIVDAYDVMTTNRPYARAKTPYEAVQTMLGLQGSFDVALLRCFVAFLGPQRSQMDLE